MPNTVEHVEDFHIIRQPSKTQMDILIGIYSKNGYIERGPTFSDGENYCQIMVVPLKDSDEKKKDERNKKHSELKEFVESL